MSKEKKLDSGLCRILIGTLRSRKNIMNCIFSVFFVNSVVNLNYPG